MRKKSGVHVCVYVRVHLCVCVCVCVCVYVLLSILPFCHFGPVRINLPMCNRCHHLGRSVRSGRTHMLHQNSQRLQAFPEENKRVR